MSRFKPSRIRSRRSTVLSFLVGVYVLTAAVGGYQTVQRRAKLPGLQKVRDNLYIIPGPDPEDIIAGSSSNDLLNYTGGNTVVFVADTGVVVIDTKFAGYGQPILDGIKTVTNKPVTTIINTHNHGDHTGGNEGFPESVDIVAHQNTKSNMSKMAAFQGDKSRFLPKRTYNDKTSLLGGKDRIDLYHFGSGHTSGDTFIVVPALRVLVTGDMFPWNDMPLIDRANGGSGVEFANTLSKAVGAISGVDTVIPGHSSIKTFRDLEEYQRFTADLLAAATTAWKSGKTTDDAAGSINFMDKYRGYKSVRAKLAIEAIYAELKQ